MKLVFNIFFLGLLFIPFYFFRSGLPQFSHFIFIIDLLLIFFISKKPVPINKIFLGYQFLLYFIIWSIGISVIFFVIYKDLKTILSPFYFIFNLSVMYSMSILYVIDKKKLIHYVFNALFLSILILYAIDFFNLEPFFHHRLSYYRKSLSFNNPNQLGYWALLVATIFFMIYPYVKPTKRNVFKFYFSITILIYLSLISLSKASTISILILLVINSLKNIKAILFLSLVSFLFYGSFNQIDNNDIGVLYRFNKRMNDVGDANDDSLEGRGYYRIKNYPEFIILGAGEGATERFDTEIEMHSSFGTILFSYGIVGLILFLMFLYKVYSLNPIKFIKILLPLLLYGITHMGLRFTLFWVSLALFILLEKKTKISSKNTLKIQENRMIQN